MSEIQTKATLDASQAVRGLTDAAAAVEKLKKKTEEANKAARDYQATIKKTSGDAAKGLGVAGGVAGAVGGKIAALGSLEGGFARAAVGVAVVTFAFKSLATVIERRIANERALVEQQQRLADIDRSAAQTGQASREASARAGIDRLDNLRGFIAEGGDLRNATSLAKRSGLSIEESASFLRKRDRLFSNEGERKTAEDAANALFQTGKMPMEMALDSFMQNPVALSAIQAGQELSAAASVANITQNRGPTNWLSASDIGEQLMRQQDDLGLRNLRAARGAQAAGQVFEIDQARADGARVANADLWAKLNPELDASTKALIALHHEQTKQVEMLQRLAEAQGTFMAIIKNASMLLGGEGSFQQQANRQQGVTAKGLFSSRAGQAVMGGP